MANVAVQGRPVEDPWLTWSVPEFGEGYWELPPEENYPGLAEQAIPDRVGPDGPEPTFFQAYGSGVSGFHAEHEGSPVPGGYGAVHFDDVTIAEDAVGDVIADAAVDAMWSGPPEDLGYYGPGASWGDAGQTPTFAQSMAGWGMLVYDVQRERYTPTLRLGYTAFWTAAAGGLLWGLLGRGY